MTVKDGAKAGLVRALGLLVLGLLLSGCWTQIGFGPENQRFNPHETSLTAANVASVQRAWAVGIPTDDEPIVSDGRVFVGYGSDFESYGVRAVDVASGNTVWDRHLLTAGEATTLGAQMVTMASGEVWTSYGSTYRPDPRGDAQCDRVQLRLNPADGSEVSRTSGVVGEPPVEGNGAVAQVRRRFPSPPSCFVDSVVLHVTPASGPEWSAPLEGGGLPGKPIIAGDLVLLPRGSHVWAYRLNGCGAATCPPTWVASLGGGPVHRVAAGADRLFVVVPGVEPHQADVVAVNQSNGAVAWRAPIGAGRARVAVAGDRVYVVTEGGLFDPEAGTSPNTLQTFKASGCGAATCTPLWTAPLGGVVPENEGPVVAGEVVYAPRGGAVVAFPAAGCGAATCEPIATLPVDGDPRAMSISDGHLFVTTGSQLVAFAPRSSA